MLIILLWYMPSTKWLIFTFNFRAAYLAYTLAWFQYGLTQCRRIYDRIASFIGWCSGWTRWLCIAWFGSFLLLFQGISMMSCTIASCYIKVSSFWTWLILVFAGFKSMSTCMKIHTHFFWRIYSWKKAHCFVQANMW